jgi:hypothetical protein
MINKKSDKTQTLTLIIEPLRKMTYQEINKVEPRESLKKKKSRKFQGQHYTHKPHKTQLMILLQQNKKGESRGFKMSPYLKTMMMSMIADEDLKKSPTM